jgi:Schlafen, AlbA_2
MADARGARSVSELLPAPFDQVGVTHVKEILARVGEEGESLYFERKAKVSTQSLAKSCAAFANTFGGLLLVGVADKSDDLAGIEPVGGEPQVWVKDVLRGHLLPMPAFRARWLTLRKTKQRAAGKGLLVVLVEESSTTPHLLTRSGAIYVRNPGSSDPVPINDQSRLLDLTRRGLEARSAAFNRSFSHVGDWPGTLLFTLTLAPTGMSGDPVRRLYGPGGIELADLEAATDFELGTPGSVRIILGPPQWSMRHVGIRRIVVHDLTRRLLDFADGVFVDSDGTVQLQRRLVSRDGDELGSGAEHSFALDSDATAIDQAAAIVPWFIEALSRGRELLLALGGHGDLCLDFRARVASRQIFYTNVAARSQATDFAASYWVDLDQDDGRDQALADQLRRDVLRSLGVSPDQEPS